jgi:hypothetical protein
VADGFKKKIKNKTIAPKLKGSAFLKRETSLSPSACFK